MPRFEARSRLPFAPAEVWAWHERPGAFRRLTPPWEVLRIRSCGDLAPGAETEFDLALGPLHRRWVARIVECHAGSEFVDTMASGPLRSWTHRHLFLPDGDGCEVRDEIEYELPGPASLGRRGQGWFERRLRRLFLFRHARVREDLARISEFTGAPLRIAVTGATGLVGRRIVDFLAGAGHSVIAIVRSSASAGRLAIPGIERTIVWDPRAPRASASDLAGFDAVVHLAGESISGRWTPERRDEIAGSRIAGTRRLCEDLLRSGAPPRVFVSASATGWYGDRGEEILDEWSPPGEGFLAEVCAGWEDASRPLSDSGVRTAHLRFGIVLAAAGGALAPMARATAWGAGAVLGTGRQWIPWIELGDLVGAVHRVVRDATMSGSINVVSPEPMRQRDFAKVLGTVLGRPVPWRIPAWAIRLGLGEMGDALLLASARVVPTRLQAAGFAFFHPSLEDALRAALGREAP